MDSEMWRQLHRRGQEICAAFGLPSQMIYDLQAEQSDWAFILKVDALLEMSCRKLVSKTLRLKIGEDLFGGPKLEAFAEKLPTVGRSSIRDLLDVAGCPRNRMRFLDAIRNIRNAYAHDISTCGETILRMALKDQNPRRLLLAMSSVQESGYD